MKLDRSAAFLIAAAAAVAVMLLLAFGVVSMVELTLRDRILTMLPQQPAAATVVVAIDEQSLQQIGRWPWPRSDLARIVDRAADAGARAVILDTLLAEPSAGDEDLARAMRRIPTVMVSVLAGPGEWLLPAQSIRNAGTIAHGNFELDHDGILRRLSATKQSRDRALTALSFEAASLLTSAPVPVGRTVAPAFRTRPRAVPLIRAADVLRAPAEQLRGKLVFVGPTALALGDRVLTPVSEHVPDPGVMVHAAATESLIRGETVRDIPPIFGGAAAGVAIAIVLSLRRARLIAAGSLVAIIVAGGVFLIATTGVAIPFVVLILGIVISTAAMLTADALRQRDVSLEQIATRLAENQAREVESKRMLAHELKTPLASMRNLSQLLGGYELSTAERRRVASLLESEAGKLQSMVHGLLDLERLPLRDFHASSTVIDLGDLVAARVEFLRASSDRPLIMSAPPRVLVRADAALIERVVDKLVENALKYAPPPLPVTITVQETDGKAIVEVEDRGSGIADAERGRIFDRFVRGSSAAGTEGLGLGLALVAEVARWHGGAVSVEDASAADGSLFRFALPMAPVEERQSSLSGQARSPVLHTEGM